MRAVVQRVKSAWVVDSQRGESGRIEQGMLILLGVEVGDCQQTADKLCQKITKLRIFPEQSGESGMQLSLESRPELEVLVVSQFTLYADLKKGNRPSFVKAAKSEIANPLYEYFCQKLSSMIERGVEQGVFGGDMQVGLVNDGPVTIIIDTDNL